jgi:glycogen synthase
MTGLIPAAAGAMGISSLFTIHNLHDEETTLERIEDAGIDARDFWQHLYFKRFPDGYENSRTSNPLSLLASGILSADETNTVSPGFLRELCEGVHGSREVGGAIRAKAAEGRVHGILNSLPADLLPHSDPLLVARYDAATHRDGKRANKTAFQLALRLEPNPDAPLVFWPSRLDPHQKGCGLLAEILCQTVLDYWQTGLQFVFVADGPGREHLEKIAAGSGLARRVAFRDFCERESRMGYAASDFTLMPSSFEPCGLSQMIGPRYGSVPVVRSTGGLRDTVTPLECDGNGILFEQHDSGALRRALDEAVRFHTQPAAARDARICRIMQAAAVSYQPADMMGRYLELYDRILHRRMG